MEAIGIVETYGLVASVEGFDTMMKAANVRLLGKAYVGNGLQSMAIIGDVAAVQAATEAAEMAIKSMGEGLFVAKHVIPRPSVAVADMIFPLNQYNSSSDQSKKQNQEADTSEMAKIEEAMDDSRIELESDEEKQIPLKKDYFDAIMREQGLQEVLQVLRTMTVVNLRKLAREYHDLGIEGRSISRADKKQLLKELETYYRVTLQ